MEIVTLAHIALHRIGSAQGGGFSSHKSIAITKEVIDDDPATLLELIVSIAEKNGESREALSGLILERGWGRTQNHVVFNIQGPSTSYTQPYCECTTFTALKAGTRYFKLEEVDM
ncbi:hypothetical protein [Pseudomonas sp. LF052]